MEALNSVLSSPWIFTGVVALLTAGLYGVAAVAAALLGGGR